METIPPSTRYPGSRTVTGQRGSSGGALVFASVGSEPGMPSVGSLADETRACITELAERLVASGAGIDRLLKANCYLSKDSFRNEFWSTWDEYFRKFSNRPMRLTQVTELASGHRVMIDVVALRNPAETTEKEHIEEGEARSATSDI